MQPPRTYSACPKCGHTFQAALPDSEACPACGIYLFKYRLTAQPDVSTFTADVAPPPSRWGTLLAPLPDQEPGVFYGRAAMWLALTIWSTTLYAYDYRDGEFGTSFMHLILLPIHEAGHVLLMPFGEFMTILGGSLMQLALPFAIGAGFLYKNRDNYAAAVCLWWTAVSLLDLAPYLYDALHPQLILLGGHTGEDGPHDWIYLFSAIGQLQHAQGWGTFAHAAGGMVMVLALCWAALILYRQHRHSAH